MASRSLNRPRHSWGRIIRALKIVIAISAGAAAVSASDCSDGSVAVKEGDEVYEISSSRNPLNGWLGVTDTVDVEAWKTVGTMKSSDFIVGLNWNWQSLNPNIATIENDANAHTDHPTVRYRALGTTVLSVTLDDPRITMRPGASSTLNISLTVGERAVRMRVNPHSVTVKVGDTAVITPEVFTASGARALDAQGGSMAYECIPKTNCRGDLDTNGTEFFYVPSVTAFFSKAMIKALHPGSTKLIVRWQKHDNSGFITIFTDTASITATSPVTPARVTVDPTSASVFVGGTKQLSAQVFDAAGNLISTTPAWTSKDANLATVNGNGLVTALSTGSGSTISNTVQIVAKAAEGVEATSTLTIYKQVATVAIDPNPMELEVGSTHPFTYTLKDNNGATIPPAATTVQWSVQDTSVATVNQSGTVTAKKPGATSLYATTAEGVRGSSDITVVAAPPTPVVVRVVVTPAAVTLSMGDGHCQFSAKAYDAEGRIVAETGFRWVIDVSSVATLDQNGLAVFRNPGTTAVRAFWGNAADAPGGAGQLTVNP